MKKKYLPLILVLLVIGGVLTAWLTRGGDIRIAHREIGQSERFTAEEIGDAMHVAEQKFKKDFEGCTLVQITYDEEISNRSAFGWAETYSAEECIVLHSRFWVGASGGDGGLNPESYYDNWQWILTRNPGEEWILQTWGYG